LDVDVLRGTSDQHIESAWLHYEAVGPHIPESELLPGEGERDGLLLAWTQGDALESGVRSAAGRAESK